MALPFLLDLEDSHGSVGKGSVMFSWKAGEWSRGELHVEGNCAIGRDPLTIPLQDLARTGSRSGVTK